MRCVYVTLLELIRVGLGFALTDIPKRVMAASKTMSGVKPICDSRKNVYLNSYLALVYCSFRPEINMCLGFHTSVT